MKTRTSTLPVLYALKDCAGRGYLAPNASTSFDLPRNWTTHAKARRFADFADASAEAQILPGRARVEIVQHSYSPDAYSTKYASNASNFSLGASHLFG